MELVIRIEDATYNMAKMLVNNNHDNIVEIPLSTIVNGVPLPKGHGRLIDADELRLDVIAHKYSNSFCDEHNIDHSINVGMLNILIADAPTIIEVDKEAEE